jgi:signal transduction histidine kinase
MRRRYERHSLERQIFLSLVGISFSSVILIAIFWASDKHQDYLKEVDRLEKNITIFRDFFDKSSSGNHYIDKSKIYYQGFDFMADSANQMVDKRMIAGAEIKKLNEVLEERVFLRWAINGFSSILATRHRNALNEEGRQYLDYVVDASQRMDQLIDDLMNYSRIGRKIIDLKIVSLNDIFDDIQIIFKSEIEKTGAAFIKDNSLPDIISDKILLHQIFTNLISNAILYRQNEVPPVIRAQGSGWHRSKKQCRCLMGAHGWSRS